MSTAAQPQRSHPLVVAYLADLERALSGADPQERVDTVAAVTEHLTDAFGADTRPDDDRVRAVLAELGPVERIAAVATPASSPQPPPGADAGRWVAPTVLAVAVVGLVLLPVAAWLSAILALVCLVVALLSLRRNPANRPLLRATVVVATLTLVAAAVMAATLLAASTSIEPSTPDVQPAVRQS